jgi:hypothetical protein
MREGPSSKSPEKIDRKIIDKTSKLVKYCKAMYEQSFTPDSVRINAMIFGLTHVQWR